MFAELGIVLPYVLKNPVELASYFRDMTAPAAAYKDTSSLTYIVHVASLAVLLLRAQSTYRFTRLLRGGNSAFPFPLAYIHVISHTRPAFCFRETGNGVRTFYVHT